MLEAVQRDCRNVQQPATVNKQTDKRANTSANDNVSCSSTIPGYHTISDAPSPNQKPSQVAKPRKDQRSDVNGDLKPKQKVTAAAQPSRPTVVAQRKPANTVQSQVARTANAPRRETHETTSQTASKQASKNHDVGNLNAKQQPNKNKVSGDKKSEKQTAKERETSTHPVAQSTASKPKDKDTSKRQISDPQTKPSTTEKPVKRMVWQSIDVVDFKAILLVSYFLDDYLLFSIAAELSAAESAASVFNICHFFYLFLINFVALSCFWMKTSTKGRTFNE